MTISSVNTTSNINHFDQLPVEMLAEIFSYLDVNDLFECSYVNKKFNQIVKGLDNWDFAKVDARSNNRSNISFVGISAWRNYLKKNIIPLSPKENF